MIKDKIRKNLEEAIKKTGFDLPKEIAILQPQNEEFGDYSSSVAMVLAKLEKQNPILVAEKILKYLDIKKLNIYKDITVAKPGFINFFLSEKYLLDELSTILKVKEKYGQGRIEKRNKINVEFISANPTGKLHVGHGRGAFYGDVLSNVLKKAGYDVTREFYINDAKNSKQIKTLGEILHGQKNPYATEFVDKLIKDLGQTENYWKTTQIGDAGFQLAEKIQLANREFIERDLGIHFDVWMSEQSLHDMGLPEKTMKWLNTIGLTYEKDEALWMKTTKFGDDKDRVLMRKTGELTYFFADIMYHFDKFERGFDELVDIWGADHHGYMERMQAAVKAMEREGDLKIIITQLVRLISNGKEVKMSKRAGTVVNLDWLVKEVGLDATRFFFLMKSVETHMDFNLDLAKEQSKKNPVYYVQYAYARISSIESRMSTNAFQATNTTNFGLLKEPAEFELIKILLKFPEIVADVSKNYEIQGLPVYAIAIADKFHNFYEKCRVLTEDEELTEARLGLVEATRIVLGETLDLMGIEKKTKM
ncbi:MAG: arginine--tRNA ligase [Patescibacteria group bacterium]|jgi:arginyl-tRNA synthetase